MPAPQLLLSVSRTEIADRIIAYFANRFHVPPAQLSWDTDLKQMFNFNDAAWAGMAGALNQLDWMKALGVRLAPAEMAGATTVAALTQLIWGKVSKIVVTNVATSDLRQVNIGMAAKPARTPAAAPRSNAKKTKRKSRS